MQPLYSVDHESRHNSVRVEDNNEVPQPTETSPLLRFPQTPQSRNSCTSVIVGVLLLILIAGVIIGIYLLVLQNASENVLPPVEMPLQLVSRLQWDRSNTTLPTQKMSSYKLKEVMIVQTHTEQCTSTETCTKLLQDMKANYTSTNDSIPYNFLISPNGQTYEALGWLNSSPMWQERSPNGLVVAFIGNYSQKAPTRRQIQEAKNLLAESVRRQYLHPSYSIIARNSKDTPNKLMESLKHLSPWDNGRHR